MKPSVGRIIHYKRAATDPDPTAAMVTQSYEAKGIWYMWLRLFPAGTTESEVVQTTSERIAPSFAEAKEGQWCWPERV